MTSFSGRVSTSFQLSVVTLFNASVGTSFKHMVSTFFTNPVSTFFTVGWQVFPSSTTTFGKQLGVFQTEGFATKRETTGMM